MEDSQSGVTGDIREVMTVLWIMPAALKRDNSSVCRNKLGGTLCQSLKYQLEIGATIIIWGGSGVTSDNNYREC